MTVAPAEDETEQRVAADRPARPAGGATPPAGRRTALVAGLAASVAALLIAALVFSVLRMHSQSDKISRLSSEAALQSSALAAAQRYGVYVSSYDYHDLNGPDAPWTLVDHNSTPSYRQDFDATKNSLAKLITTYQATSVGKVTQAAVQSATPMRAVVLLFVDQTVTNSAQKQGTQTQPLRVVLTLSRSGGQWLIDDLKAS